MKTTSILFVLFLAASAYGRPVPETPNEAIVPGALEPVIITAPSVREKRSVRRLKRARAVGGVAALSGAGLMSAVVIFAGTGPIGWASGMIFFGGMTAYLSHRRLHGEKDFGPLEPDL